MSVRRVSLTGAGMNRYRCDRVGLFSFHSSRQAKDELGFPSPPSTKPLVHLQEGRGLLLGCTCNAPELSLRHEVFHSLLGPLFVGAPLTEQREEGGGAVDPFVCCSLHSPVRVRLFSNPNP